MKRQALVKQSRAGRLQVIRISIGRAMPGGGRGGANASCIDKLSLRRDSDVIADVYCGPNISENPLFVFKVANTGPFGEIRACWRDGRSVTGKSRLVAEGRFPETE